jgi:hypothetical protein
MSKVDDYIKAKENWDQDFFFPLDTSEDITLALVVNPESSIFPRFRVRYIVGQYDIEEEEFYSFKHALCFYNCKKGQLIL